MNRTALAVCLGSSLVWAPAVHAPAFAQTVGTPARAIAVLTPAPGSPEHREIVALVRRPLLRRVGEAVQLDVSRMNVMGACGYVVATAAVAGGAITEKDWTAAFGACRSPAGGHFAPQIRVLLKAVRGIWQMAEYEVCPPRGEEARWVQRYDTTMRLFGASGRVRP